MNRRIDTIKEFLNVLKRLSGEWNFFGVFLFEVGHEHLLPDRRGGGEDPAAVVQLPLPDHQGHVGELVGLGQVEHALQPLYDRRDVHGLGPRESGHGRHRHARWSIFFKVLGDNRSKQCRGLDNTEQ